MEFAVELASDDHVAAEELLSHVASWSKPKGREYFMAALKADHPLLEGCKRAFFLKIEPGGNIHRHKDAAAEAFDTDLIVVSTNERCRTCWKDRDGVEHSRHLELGKRYLMQARDLEHWATNDGDTDRVHLVIEYPK